MALTPEVRKWVKNQIAAGYSREQVIVSLRQQGWSKEDINELFPETKHVGPFIKPKPKPQNQLPKILAILVLVVIVIGGYQLLFRGEIQEEEPLGNVSEEIGIENGVQELEEEQPQQEITEEEVDQPQITQETIDISQLRTASILEVPMPMSFHCFVRENENNPECSQYYKEECYGERECRKVLACPKYYNPVCGADRLFYPSACWAEQLGTTVASYGYCDSLEQFISDLWLTKKLGRPSYVVPSPNIEFTYLGSGLEGWKNGAWLRSTLWKGSKEFVVLDFNIQTTQGEDWSTSQIHRTALVPVMDSTPKVLLVFVMFDDAYPESVLLDWTETYEDLMNDYIQKKQEVPNPIQYDILPVVISPPIGVERPSPSHFFFSDEELQKIRDAALQKVAIQDFDIFTISSVVIGGFGGYFRTWDNKQLITSPLYPPAPYSATDKKAGLDSLGAFHQMFSTLSHEVLHAVGLEGDHMPMGYGTLYLSPVGQNVDPVTGNKKEGEKVGCDFLGTSPDYYAVEVPPEFKISVGQEPDWLNKQESVNGDCLSGLYNNAYLKDYDNDGEYEIMYSNNLIGIELQRSLGWVDVDGDSIAELIDADAYGGWKEVEKEPEVSAKREVIVYTVVTSIGREQFFSSFEPIEEVVLDKCTFERVTLKDNKEGLVPLQCAEFNSYVVNLYKGVKYQWAFVEKEYGTVILPILI